MIFGERRPAEMGNLSCLIFVSLSIGAIQDVIIVALGGGAENVHLTPGLCILALFRLGNLIRQEIPSVVIIVILCVDNYVWHLHLTVEGGDLIR